MNKKLGRLIQPNFGIYFVFLAGFALAAALMQQYSLAVAEALLTVAVLLWMDREVLKRVDYSLLLTFVGFFVFIGNMGRVPAFNAFLQKIITGNEVMTAVLSSQVISNVPAALLLSGFTQDYPALIVGTNLGGLGTLIASMASLISFKYLGQEEKSSKGKYLLYFTVANLIFLVILLGLWMLLGR
jgi:di/tricarboxylate transporter